ncbi:hypothetical protein B0J14DRAFT_605312 [Halenospora varia]|nr:hypothetical protein B0J14DRAFT_605312 [Halenospora varia]
MVNMKSTPRAGTCRSLRQRHTTQQPSQAPLKPPKPTKEKRKYVRKPTFKFFPRLPTELRLKIWHLAIPDPRIINLHVHAPMKIEFPGFYIEQRCMKAISFTASLLPTTTPMKILRYGRISRPNPVHAYLEMQKEWRGLHPDKAVTPPGPSMLSVCSESREVALQYYDLEFGGVHWMDGNRQFKERWERYGLGEKTIWVDFRRDVVFLEVINIIRIQNLMQVLWHFVAARDEGGLGRIRRLGIGGRWGSQGAQWHNEIKAVVEQPKFGRTFGSVEELFVWDNCEVMWEGAEPRRGTVYEVSKKDLVERKVREDLEGMKKKKGWWDKDRPIPVVRVMRGEDRIGDVVRSPVE